MKVACICGRQVSCRHGSFVEADGRLIMKSIAGKLSPELAWGCAIRL